MTNVSRKRNVRESNYTLMNDHSPTRRTLNKVSTLRHELRLNHQPTSKNFTSEQAATSVVKDSGDTNSDV